MMPHRNMGLFYLEKIMRRAVTVYLLDDDPILPTQSAIVLTMGEVVVEYAAPHVAAKVALEIFANAIADAVHNHNIARAGFTHPVTQEPLAPVALEDLRWDVK